MPNVPGPMTGNRIALLRMLDELGPVRSEHLTRGQKMIAAWLQRDGYAAWVVGVTATRHSLAGHILRITDAGREELRSVRSVPATD